VAEFKKSVLHLKVVILWTNSIFYLLSMENVILLILFLNSPGNYYDYHPLTTSNTFTNPVFDGADPWITKKNDFYYYCYSSGNSIFVSRSRFITRKGELKKIWTAPKKGWNRSNVWAPELHFIRDRWYVYYAAGESGPPFVHQKAGVLMSSSKDPFSEYKDMGILYTGDNPDMKSDNRWAIDMTVFRFRNKLYALWSGWIDDAETDKTPQHLFIAEMESPVRMKKPRKKISSPDLPWETGGPLDLEEGPEILKHKRDLFVIYSCRESWTVDYRLGLLRLKNRRDPLTSAASWEESGPVFRGPYGAGHCSFTKSPSGKEDWILYHSKKEYTEGWKRDVRMQPFKWTDDGYPDFGTPVGTGVEIKRPDGELKVENKLNKKSSE
jgi:GH43 family beta-xylosidase